MVPSTGLIEGLLSRSTDDALATRLADQTNIPLQRLQAVFVAAMQSIEQDVGPVNSQLQQQIWSVVAPTRLSWLRGLFTNDIRRKLFATVPSAELEVMLQEHVASGQIALSHKQYHQNLSCSQAEITERVEHEVRDIQERMLTEIGDMMNEAVRGALFPSQSQ
jgi:hypothetical protein